MNIPISPWTLMLRTYRNVLPTVRFYLNEWKQRANQIPNPELRKQALTSIEKKTFHCEGGAIYGLLAKNYSDELICFIVAYQTISDYLDNLCDRSTSLAPEDFRALHESMFHALTPGAECVNYYRYRQDQEDGGYLRQLVKTCQDVLEKLPAYPKISSALYELASYYCELQVHKHVQVEERVPRLKAWFELHQDNLPEMSWYEFSACAGSTLGIFCLIAYASDENCTEDLIKQIKNAYFPWLQGLHILLDYLIDQEEDRLGGDLNFCFYYKNRNEMTKRFTHFVQKAKESVAQLPHTNFHQMINQALIGIYLADEKVRSQKEVQEIGKHLIRFGGGSTFFFFLNGRVMALLR
ncbi:tetraprenyl-beta-curcumene synthase family protein [Tolypothrix campylonemoides VB511288]|nr:tetraprenyl-beta-curcumene synthase family protein [Tolypothrix campylonemoides VB511288]